jgi:ribose transport system permease protein
VTLCGLLLYRGFARYLTDDQSQGFGNSYEGLRQLAIGKLQITGTFALPFSLFILVAVALVAHVFLERTIWGRYLLALGRNETATRFSGINTDRMKILAYVVCSLLAGVGGILFSLNLNSIQPSGLGEFYELYAIAAAVLGGCSLRGGEGTILGVIIGTAVMRVLYNSINILGIPTHLEFAIIGAVILAGVVADEVVKRIAARRAAARQLEGR